jgi:hypothetical protein
MSGWARRFALTVAAGNAGMLEKFTQSTGSARQLSQLFAAFLL